MDWWQGSNHGIDASLNKELASSAFVSFVTDPLQNYFTGAGPVWGCTIVSVVSDRGAWTGHFWQGFFENDDLFHDQVIEFLAEGNQAEGYPGLANLVIPGGPFDLAQTKFLGVTIMTPEGWTHKINAQNPFQEPELVRQTGQIRYLERFNAIVLKLDSIFGISNLKVTSVVYPFDETVWSFINVSTDPNICEWYPILDRSPRLKNGPWTGMLTIQRRATQEPRLAPAVRIFAGSDLVFNQAWAP
ncbi:hypothetical protein NQ176_g3652 [Zarea fungicola]|uniref:Uncharacterized protein n=1 Tax=Zarea fungicola TaxID=93591 RepID=A0ACC1NIJ9_9HYPO|nr:hypothetical protein NQ176_g3652 [Lecanicillium fungicola]